MISKYFSQTLFPFISLIDILPKVLAENLKKCHLPMFLKLLWPDAVLWRHVWKLYTPQRQQTQGLSTLRSMGWKQIQIYIIYIHGYAYDTYIFFCIVHIYMYISPSIWVRSQVWVRSPVWVRSQSCLLVMQNFYFDKNSIKIPKKKWHIIISEEAMNEKFQRLIWNWTTWSPNFLLAFLKKTPF